MAPAAQLLILTASAAIVDAAPMPTTRSVLEAAQGNSSARVETQEIGVFVRNECGLDINVSAWWSNTDSIDGDPKIGPVYLRSCSPGKEAWKPGMNSCSSEMETVLVLPGEHKYWPYWWFRYETGIRDGGSNHRYQIPKRGSSFYCNIGKDDVESHKAIMLLISDCEGDAKVHVDMPATSDCTESGEELP